MPGTNVQKWIHFTPSTPKRPVDVKRGTSEHVDGPLRITRYSVEMKILFPFKIGTQI